MVLHPDSSSIVWHICSLYSQNTTFLVWTMPLKTQTLDLSPTRKKRLSQFPFFKAEGIANQHHHWLCFPLPEGRGNFRIDLDFNVSCRILKMTFYEHDFHCYYSMSYLKIKKTNHLLFPLESSSNIYRLKYIIKFIFQKYHLNCN